MEIESITEILQYRGNRPEEGGEGGGGRGEGEDINTTTPWRGQGGAGGRRGAHFNLWCSWSLFSGCLLPLIPIATT